MADTVCMVYSTVLQSPVHDLMCRLPRRATFCVSMSLAVEHAVPGIDTATTEPLRRNLDRPKFKYTASVVYLSLIHI